MTITLEGRTDFVIFFDNQHIQRFVQSFSVSSGVNGRPAEASVSLIYTEAFMKIEYLTDVRIFVKNIFSGKYKMVFDGQIHARQVNIGPRSKTITFTCYDYIHWMQRTPVPILFDVRYTVSNLQTLSWLSKGINFNHVDFALTAGEAAIAGKNLEEVINEIYSKVDKAMTWHSGDSKADYNNIYSWSAVSSKLRVLSEVSKHFRQDNIIDFRTEGAILENMYTFLNGIVSKLGFEMYQDTDGIIKIKQPFWHEGILKPFVLDRTIVTNMDEVTNWDNKCSRTFVIGGIEQTLSRGMDEFGLNYWTPAATYVGESGYTVTGDSVFPPEVPPEGDSYVKDKPQNSPTASRQAIASIAMEYYYRDVPYELGGGHPGHVNEHKGVDCSGLVYLVYRAAGYDVRSATANGYYEAGDPVEPSQIQVGDLGFSNMGKFRKGEWGHVGIYVGIIDGLHSWVHASGREDDMKLYQSSYIGGFWEAYCNLVSTIERGYVATGHIAKPRGTSHQELTELTDWERKYGINVYEVQQPLIRVGTGEGTDPATANNQLLEYGKYMYHVMRATSTTASMSLIAAPWLRPGFNIWFDPTGMSRVYYIQNIRHSGDANGVYTSLGLVYGRSEEEFKQHYTKATGKNPFTLTEHIDSTEYFLPPGSGGGINVVNNSNMGDFKSYVKKIQKSSEDSGSTVAYNSPYRDWYGKDFIRRNTQFLNRWDTEFNLLELYCILAAEYNVINSKFINQIPVGEGPINPTTPSERKISSFAKKVVDYAVAHAEIPPIISTRVSNLANIIREGEKQLGAKYTATPEQHILPNI